MPNKIMGDNREMGKIDQNLGVYEKLGEYQFFAE
jgi:hypothetical protein